LEDIQLSQDKEYARLIYALAYKEGCREVRERNLEGQAKEEFGNKMFLRQENKLQDKGQGYILLAVILFALKLLSARWFSQA
jgi:hypothetical protein